MHERQTATYAIGRFVGVGVGLAMTVGAFLFAILFMSDDTHAPWAAKAFGCVIAIGVAIVALGLVARALKPAATPQAPSESVPTPPTAGYVCTKCGAPLSEGADVSPSGDVKCQSCKSWFNIHAEGASR